MNNSQTIRHILTLVLSFAFVGWFIWRYEFTAYQVAYAAGLTFLLMIAAFSLVIGIATVLVMYQRKRGEVQ